MATNPNAARFGCYVGHIDRTVTLDMLKTVFGQCGTIIDCSLNGRDGDPYRYGFIDFATEDDRARAMKYDGYTLLGRKLKVGVSRGNVNRPEGMNGAGNGSMPNNNMNNNMRMANNGMRMSNPMMGGAMGMDQLMMNQFGAGGMDPFAAQQLQMMLSMSQQAGGDPTSAMANMANNTTNNTNNSNPNPANAMNANNNNNNNNGGMPGAMGFPTMMPQMWGGGMGRGFGGGPGMHPMMGGPNRPMGYHRGPANPIPSEETMKLREVQRKQFLEVVRREAEKYERKHHKASGDGSGSAANAAAASADAQISSDESTASDDGMDEPPVKKAYTEPTTEAEAPAPLAPTPEAASPEA